MTSPVVRAIVLAFLLTGCRRAPVSGTPVRPERECGSLAQLLGPAAPEPGMARVLKRIRACPVAAGSALAAGILDLRLERDTLRLARVMDLTQNLHDSRVFAAALTVAGDRGAAPAARVLAFRTLIWSKAPGHWIPYGALVTDPGAPANRWLYAGRSTYTGHFYGGGPVAGDTTSWPVFGAPLAADYQGRILHLCTSVAADSVESGEVRSAARHACKFEPDEELEALRRARGGP